MEPIQHSHQPRRKKNTAKTNVTISLVIHLIIFALGAYWAAHEGVLGQKLRELSVGLLPKEKKIEEKKAEAKTDGPKKVETKPVVETAKTATPPPPKFVAPPPAAVESAAPPPAVTLPGDFFVDKDSLTAGDAVTLYKQQVETALRSRWDRPGDVADVDFVAEVEMHIDMQGKISSYDWKKGSGNTRWDNSVKKALAAGAINRSPPKNFPNKFTVRFDVQPATEPLISRAD
jgi:hypothetical protein